MWAAIIAAASAALGWYYPRWMGAVPDKFLAGLLGSVGALAIVVLLLITGIVASAFKAVSVSSAGTAALIFGAAATISVAYLWLSKGRLKVRNVSGVVSAQPVSRDSGSSPDRLNWSEGLFRLWVMGSVVWGAVSAIGHIVMVAAGNLRPEVAVGSFLFSTALPPLGVALLGFGVAWVVAGFRRDKL